VQPLATALGLSAPIRVPAEDAGIADADLHAAVSGIADRLLERIAAVTALLQQDSAPIGERDRLAARLLLSDLSLLAIAWQSLGTVATGRLDAAAERLADARHVLDRALRSNDSAI
jgi:hypothetical protein